MYRHVKGAFREKNQVGLQCARIINSPCHCTDLLTYCVCSIINFQINLYREADTVCATECLIWKFPVLIKALFYSVHVQRQGTGLPSGVPRVSSARGPMLASAPPPPRIGLHGWRLRGSGCAPPPPFGKSCIRHCTLQ